MPDAELLLYLAEFPGDDPTQDPLEVDRIMQQNASSDAGDRLDHDIDTTPPAEPTP